MSRNTNSILRKSGKEARPTPDPRILLEESGRSVHAAHRIPGRVPLGNSSDITLEKMLASQKQNNSIKAQRDDNKRRSLLGARDSIDQQGENLIRNIHEELKQTTSPIFLMTIPRSMV